MKPPSTDFLPSTTLRDGAIRQSRVEGSKCDFERDPALPTNKRKEIMSINCLLFSLFFLFEGEKIPQLTSTIPAEQP